MHDETNPDPWRRPACGLSAHLLRQSNHSDTTMKQNPNLTREWDKVFPQSDRVNHSKVTFRNRYGITLAADLYIPRNASGNCPPSPSAVVLSAVKEQASGLYAQTLAERGIPHRRLRPVSTTGESGGEPRYVASPDINTEDFSAAVDYLDARRRGPRTDRYPRHLRIRRFAINAAAIDTRIKSDSGFHDVRHQPLHGERIFRHDGCRRTLRTPPAAQRPAHGRREDGHLRAGRRG